MPKSLQINTDFFKHWSREMAYVLGFFFADGSLTATKRNSYYLSFHAADRELLCTIKDSMDSSHSISERSPRSGRVYRLQIGSKEMFSDLFMLGVGVRKTTRLRLPPIPNRFFGDFVRGYFDGDGNVWTGVINKQRKKPTAVLQVGFTSGCRAFLRSLLARLHEQHDMRGGSVFAVKNKDCARLSFSTLDALKLYKIMYNEPNKFFLKRKKLIFEKFIQMRP